jgi:hypothetical protein
MSFKDFVNFWKDDLCENTNQLLQIVNNQNVEKIIWHLQQAETTNGTLASEDHLKEVERYLQLIKQNLPMLQRIVDKNEQERTTGGN